MLTIERILSMKFCAHWHNLDAVRYQLHVQSPRTPEHNSASHILSQVLGADVDMPLHMYCDCDIAIYGTQTTSQWLQLYNCNIAQAHHNSCS